MTSTRRTAVLVGLLFLMATATAAFLIADQLIVGAAENATALTTAALLAFVDGLAVVGIAVLLYPLLKDHSEPLAHGYIGFRVAEFAAILFYMAIPLLMVTLGDGFANGTVDESASPHLSSLFLAQYDVAIVMVYLFTSVAGLILAYLLFRTRLIPRWIAILGIIGYPVLLIGTVLDLFGVIDVTQGAGFVAVVPGGFFELILPIWLLAKGFAVPSKNGERVRANPA